MATLQPKWEKLTRELYRLGQLTIASDIDLPGLPQVQDSPADVVIRIAELPSFIKDAVEVEPRCLANDREYLYRLPGVAGFYVRGGEEIIVEPYDLSRVDELRSILYSTIFALLFLRRGLLPLHASAVSVNGQVFGFLGRSGAGKSSLAAFLGRRGYPVVADDLTLLKRTARARTEVVPCAPCLKLWRDTLDGLENSVEGLELIAGKDSKYRVPFAGLTANPEQSLPLAGLLLLQSTHGEPARIALLEPAAAIVKLMLYAYPVLLIHKLGADATLFRQCGEILRDVPMWTFTRAWDLTSIEQSTDLLAHHLNGLSVKGYHKATV